jgi:hypothetical protein
LEFRFLIKKSLILFAHLDIMKSTISQLFLIFFLKDFFVSQEKVVHVTVISGIVIHREYSGSGDLVGGA